MIDGKFQRGKRGTRVYMGAEGTTTVFTAYYPSIKGDGFYDPLIISRRAVKKTLFAAVLQVELPGKVKTFAHITCDRKNLYLAFDCSEPFMDKRIRTRTVRDSKVWRDDAVDLIFDTPAERSRYFYFALNCIGAKFDEKTIIRLGERDKNDVDWNPDWKAKTVMGKNGWTAEVAIPFASLGVNPPEKGEVWRINMRRWRHTVIPKQITKWAPEFWVSEERGNLIFW